MILGRFNKHNKGKYVATWISLGSENKSERCVLLRKIMRAKPIESPVWDIMDNALILGLKELSDPKRIIDCKEKLSLKVPIVNTNASSNANKPNSLGCILLT
jgi:hypothetical protein